MGCQRGGAKNLPEANIKLKTYLDCIPCFFRQALAAARMSSADETIHRRVLNSVALMIPDLAIDATPPEIAQQVYRISYEITGNNDPYLEAKRCANIFFLFKVKCAVIARDSGYDLDSPVLMSSATLKRY